MKSDGTYKRVEATQRKEFNRTPISGKITGRGKSIELLQRSSVEWKTAKKICTLPVTRQTCPKCSSALADDYTLLPISEQTNAKINGQCCRNCGIIYVEKDLKPELNKLMRDNPLSKGFTLDDRELWNASAVEKEQVQREKRKQRLAEQKQRLRNIPHAVVVICTKEQGIIREYVITNGNAIPNESNVFYYKSPIARELLSAAFAEQKEKKGVLCGKNYKVIGVVLAEGHAKGLPFNLLPVELVIEADGGYSSSVVNSNYELVDLLVYSPFSQRYELMRSTYSKECGYCYTDIGIFRRFVREYGNPEIDIDFHCSNSNSFFIGDLKCESVLMMYGYNVSKANNLSERDRCEMLAEIVDLKILKVHQIVFLLDSFCRLHPGAMYASARAKWTHDKEFIENYKVNPERFLIAHSYKLSKGKRKK